MFLTTAAAAAPVEMVVKTAVTMELGLVKITRTKVAVTAMAAVVLFLILF